LIQIYIVSLLSAFNNHSTWLWWYYRSKLIPSWWTTCLCSS